MINYLQKPLKIIARACEAVRLKENEYEIAQYEPRDFAFIKGVV